MKRLLIACVVTLFAPCALAQVQTYINIPGIPGDVVQPNYESQIAVLDWSQGAANIGNGPVVLPFRFIHRLDVASPLLMSAVLQGTNLGTVQVRSILVNGPEPIEFFRLDLVGARVVSVNTSSDPAAGGIEEVTMDCNTFELSYVPQDETGAPDDPVTITGNCTN